MSPNSSEVARVDPNAISRPPAFFRRPARRLLAAALALVALACAPLARATPTISITAPTTGSTLTLLGTPPSQTINVTTAIGSSPGGTVVSSVNFLVNGVSIGTVGGGAFGTYSITWFPTATGSYTLTAIVTDTSVITTGTTPNLNTATSPLVIVTVTGFGPTVSLTNPTNASSLGLGAAVNITATAAATGIATVSRVDFLAGATVLGSAFAAPYTFSWIPSTAGSVSLTARVIDSANFTATSAAAVVNITVPSVTLTSPLNGAGVSLGSTVALTASASAVSPATVAKVDFLSGGSLIGTATTAPYTVNWTPATAGAVSLTARVTDSNGAPVTSTAVAVTVTTSAPTVALTAPANGAVVTVGTATTLAATAAGAGSATVTRVDFLSGTTVLGTATSAPYTFAWTPTVAGVVSLTARVTDSNATTATSAVVTVTATAAAATTVSLTAPANNSVATTGTAVTVTAGVVTGGGVTVSRVDFFSGATAIGSALVAPYTISWIPSAAGINALTARVTDANNAVVTSAIVNVSVVAAATPTVVITAPVVGAVVAVNSSVAVTAAATPGAGATVAQVQFSVGATVIGTVTTAPYTVVWTPTVAGNFSLTARVLDSANAAVTSAAVTVTAATATAVALTAPANNAAAATGAPVTLTAGATAGTGATISSVAFFANGVAIGSPVSVAPYTLAWTPAPAGAIAITARATDSLGVTATSAAITVNVSDSAAPAIALTLSPGAAPATTFPVGATRYILAAVTPGLGRAIVRVEFFIDGAPVFEKTTAPYVYKFTAPAATGTYVLTARATDNAGLTRDSVATTLTVTAAVGTPPTAVLISPGNNANAVPGTAVSLAATAQAIGGTVAGVQFYANGAVIGAPITASPYTGTFVLPAAGTYVIEAIATDDRGNTAVSNAATVTAAFSAPTVALTAPAGTLVSPTRATPGVPFTLAATAAGGSNASVLLVEFLVGGNVVGSRTAPTVANGSTYSFLWTPTAAQVGGAIITARVTDTNSLSTTSAPAYVSVVTLTTPPPVITGVAVNPGAALNLQTLSVANLVATVAPGNTARTIAGVEFFLSDGVNATRVGNGVRETATGNLYRLVYLLDSFDRSAITPNAAGGFPVQLFVIGRDDLGVQTQSGLVNLVLNPSSSAPPTIQIQSLAGAPGSTAATIAQGNAFPLLALPADADGSVASVQLYSNGVPSGAAQLNPTNGGFSFFTFNPAAAGVYRLFVAVTDDTANTNLSSVFTLTVTATIAPVVTLNRPVDNTTVTNVGAPTYLDATVTLVDQTLTPTVQFTVSGSGGRPVPAINANRVGTTTTYRGIFINATADTYTIAATASVANGTISATSAVSRTVRLTNASGNLPTIALTGFPGTATSASTVNLLATATDSDGSVASVEFFLNRNSIGFAERQQLTNLWRITTSFAGLVVPAGYEVQAIARDNAGNAAATPVATLSLTSATSAAPTVRIGTSAPTVAFGRTLALTATGSDADGTIASVQYFSNGTNIGTSTTGPTYPVTFTGTAAGTFGVYAVATDATGNTSVSNNLTITVKPDNPLLDDTAFILQTSIDLANATPNAVVLAAYEIQLATGALTRARLAVAVATNNGALNNANFNNTANALAAYWLLMGEWPTTANYTTIFNARGSLPNVCGAIISSPEYLIKYGANPTAGLLNNPNGVLPAATFLRRLHAAAGMPAPSQLEILRFMSNDTANVSLGIGRGYQVAGLNTAIAEFISITNAGNTALVNLGRTAALHYQLARPIVLTPLDAALTANTVSTPAQVAARIATLARLPDLNAVADSVLSDRLYAFRYVTITRQPAPLTVAARSGAIFSVEALGAPPISYQWLQNGAPIAGATAPSLYLTNVAQAQAGNYSVVVTTSAGSVTSNPALLTLSAAPTRLGNISSRGVAGGGTNALIAGFVVTGTGTKQMLIRVVGPTLAGQIAGFLPDPNLTLRTSAGVVVQTNDNWGAQVGAAAAVTAIQQATNRLGAFALPANSLDAVVLATLQPGGYTVEARGAGATTGVAIVEVYDASTTLAGPKAINVSTRANVGTGENVLIAGFIINGTVSRRVLVRGVGPTLRIFPGIAANSVLVDPQLRLQLQDANRTTLATNDDWAAGDDAAIVAVAASASGAFALPAGSKDASILLMLPPGSYTATLSGVGATNSTGIGLIEVYDVDP